MTERDVGVVQLSIINILGDNPDGMCVPLAVIESCSQSMSSDALNSLPDKIIKAWQNPDEDIDSSWLKIARIFYPNSELSDLGFRSSQDECFAEILEYAYKNHCPTIFCIPGFADDGHAVGINFSRLNGKDLIVEMIYGLKKVRPIINVTQRSVVRDLYGIAEDFLNNARTIVVFPPENEMSF